MTHPVQGSEAEDFFQRLNRLRRELHDGVLRLATDLTDEQLRRRPGPHAPAVGFHIWHLGRWADHDRAMLDGTPQIWESRGLARTWGLASGGLGKADAGTEMGDEASESLVLPEKSVLLEYTDDAFAALDSTFRRFPPRALFDLAGPPDDGKCLLDFALTFVTHDNRHLGMIEALRGVMGLSGTASN